VKHPKDRTRKTEEKTPAAGAGCASGVGRAAGSAWLARTMRACSWLMVAILAGLLAYHAAPVPVKANPGSQTWYLSDFTAGVSGADYIMYRGSGDGTSDALNIAKGASKVWAADETSNISCRMSGSWSVALWAVAEPPSSSLTLEVGVLSGGTFVSKGVSAEQSVTKNGGTLSFSVTTASHSVGRGEYLAVRVNNTSGNKGLDLDVNDVSGNSPCFVTSPATADDYPGVVLISFTVTDYGSDGIDFGNLNPGGIDQPADQTAEQGAVTLSVGAETNVPVNIQLKGTDLSGPATFTLADADIQYDDDSVLDEGTETGLNQGTLTTSYVIWYPVAAYSASTQQCYHWISIPAGQMGGNYTSTFYYQAAEQ
jgi:hypothetical protein